MMYHRFRPVAIGVEQNGIGLATLLYLQVAGHAIYDVNADADKYSRAVPIAMRYKAWMAFHRSGAPYLETFESELLSFPKGKYDDRVDMAAYAARLMVPVKSQQTAQVVYEEDYSISPV
jgi:phage terminase large subunit-like protein